jgi:hypothetical protein
MTTAGCTDSEKKFYDAAKELQATGGYWATFSTGDLAEWLKQHGNCAYCGGAVVDEYHVVNRLGTGTTYCRNQSIRNLWSTR